jgi:hypothetical protein
MHAAMAHSPHVRNPPVADSQVRNYIEKQAVLQKRPMIVSVQ